jgi:outer membrane protein assembly factor BamB
LTWELGGEEKGPLSDCYFLGPPLPLDGKLYVLIQKDDAQTGELRLVCLDPSKKGLVEWQAALTTVPEPMRRTPFRRMQALHVAAADGLLICPIHAGSLIAVDQNTGKIRWRCAHREAKAVAPAAGSEWMVTAPILHDGKIVFTAPDSQYVYCVNLKTGRLVWKAARDKDLYLGGVSSGSVLLVGPKSCRALRLSDGKLRWRTETGLPSGQGTLHADHYYLPLQEAAASGKPEICVLDIVKGTIVKRLRLPDDAVPGNLVFTDGILVSQGVRSLIAYVPEKDK